MSNVYFLFLRAKLYCDRDGVNYVEHALEWDRPGVGQIALYMFIEAVVLMVLTLLIEVRPLTCIIL